MRVSGNVEYYTHGCWSTRILCGEFREHVVDVFSASSSGPSPCPLAAVFFDFRRECVTRRSRTASVDGDNEELLCCDETAATDGRVGVAEQSRDGDGGGGHTDRWLAELRKK